MLVFFLPKTTHYISGRTTLNLATISYGGTGYIEISSLHTLIDINHAFLSQLYVINFYHFSENPNTCDRVYS